MHILSIHSSAMRLLSWSLGLLCACSKDLYSVFMLDQSKLRLAMHWLSYHVNSLGILLVSAATLATATFPSAAF
jgi:hypothetical protein